MDALWHIEMLGGLRARQGDRVITRFRTQKTASLLAYLAYHLRQRHPREVLIELLWPEADEAEGRASLSTARSSLGRQLEPPGVPAGSVLLADRASLHLNPELVTTDVAQFEEALRAASAAEDEFERVRHLTQAADLYRGELLPGFYEEWCLSERVRLAEAYWNALRQLIQHHQRRGEGERALQYAYQGVSADPLREPAHEQVIRLLAASGQVVAALQHYRELAALLARELGAAPSPSLRRLAGELETGAPAAPSRAETSGRRTEQLSSSALPSPPLPSPRPAPVGTVTFLAADLVAAGGEDALAGHTREEIREQARARLRSILLRHRSDVLTDEKGKLQAVFGRATDALLAAIQGQSDLIVEGGTPDVAPAESSLPVSVRIALHTGELQPEAEVRGCPALAEATHLLQAAHPGQILLTESTAGLVRDAMPEGIRLLDLGLYRLAPLATPRRLFQIEDPQLAPRAFPPPLAIPAYAASLPPQFTSFFGRREDLARVREWLLVGQAASSPAEGEGQPNSLPHGRLVTLTGPGGCGKTRLSIEVAQSLMEPLAGAVWFVALTDVTDSDRLADAVRHAMGLPNSPAIEPMEQVVAALSHRRSLLVLDNMEHLLEPGIELVETLRERVPDLACLVTSRQRLELAGEQELALEPLPAPEESDALEAMAGCPSVQLFVDRAQAVRPDFQLTRQTAPLIGALCRRLEGLPLAIELAAARAQVFSLSQMLAQLEQPFAFLASRRRDLPSRHRTLRACIEWSFRLLPPSRQRLFTCLSVFHGGWTLEAAEALCQETESVSCPAAEDLPSVAEAIAELLAASLITTKEREPEIRFCMLETLQEYATEQLAPEERERMQRRHAGYYRSLAGQADSELRGPEQVTWLARLEAEQDNIRAALEWSLENDPQETGLRLAGALFRFWRLRGYWREGRDWLERAVERNVRDTRKRTSSGGVQRHETSHAAPVLYAAGALAWLQGERETGHSRLLESAALARETGDDRTLAAALSFLGLAHQPPGQRERKRAYYGEGATICREIGDRWGLAVALTGMGTTLEPDDPAARRWHEEALALFREAGDRWGTGLVLAALGTIARREGDLESARSLYEESLAMRRQVGDVWQIALSLGTLGDVARQQGDYERAAGYYEESLELHRKLQYRSGIASTLRQLAEVTLAQGDRGRAAGHFRESLALHRDLRDAKGILLCLTGLARLAAEERGQEQAGRMIAAAQHLYATAGSRLDPAERADYERHLAAVQEQLGDATEEWSRTLPLEQVIAEALSAIPPR